MPSTAFKPTAPVLPAMGLYSFHNDSPPFVGAATSETVEPDFLCLRPPFVNRPSSAEVERTVAPPSIPMPIHQRGFTPTITPPESNGTPTHRILASEEDEHLSSSRSRRLVSGYHFGNSPWPVDGHSPGSRDDNLPMDSPPLTEPSPNDDNSPRPDPIQEMQVVVPAIESLQGSTDRRRSSKSRERDAGYEVLNGLGDGEADLDEAAQPAAFGTEAYLKGVEGQAGAYRFPKHRLRKAMKDESKIPLVIVACGSFSPPTYLHLRMFEMAKDEVVESQTYEIMAGYYSPVSSYYKKAGLAPAPDRVRMCELAVEHTSTWLMVDPWEAGQSEYKRTALVLEHFDELLNTDGGGMTMSDGKKRRFKIMLLAGGDLIESFGEPGVWSEPDLHIILGRFGCLIVERAGSDVWAFLLSHDILYHHRRNVIVIKQLIYNDISSTKVRLFVRRGMSIKYLLPNSVIQYIHDRMLYREPDAKTLTTGA